MAAAEVNAVLSKFNKQFYFRGEIFPIFLMTSWFSPHRTFERIMVFLCFFENYFNKSPLQTQLKMDSRKMHNKFDYFMILQSLQLSALASKARRKMSFLFITRLLIVCAEEGEILHDYNAIKSPDLQCFYFISYKILRANKFQSR